ncbi:uncharacterized protein C8Q71DRAFT_906402 [Rhodofomes roseus]|uniref:Uncharacterized protein n=1 Tax=Rhodofomes roseus TaxID=34475 RepID=A0ABQ8KKL8_9APHY|nr:uncharacterized protein C8Q71DRAFT_906402 [Rhodofomes roseus]KAH9838626.1 hypothetical protein C8Q71DRAFT_906402 [Rhodofomes roseus]
MVFMIVSTGDTMADVVEGSVPQAGAGTISEGARLQSEKLCNISEGIAPSLPSSPIPSSSCPSLSDSVGTSVASTAATSVPPTPVDSPYLGELEVNIGGSENVSSVEDAHNVGILHVAPKPIEFPPQLSPCPSPLARRSSNLVPILLSSACDYSGNPCAPLTHTPDPFGAFSESHFADEPKGSVDSAHAAPDLYNFDIYAPSSTPPRRQRTREFRENRTVSIAARSTSEKATLSNPAKEQNRDSARSAPSKGPQETVCKAPVERISECPPRLRILLLPQEVDRRASREISAATAPPRGIRPLMLPLHIAQRDTITCSPPALPDPRLSHAAGASRLSLPSAKAPVSYPPPRVRPSSGSNLRDLEHGSDAPGDAISIVEKEKRCSRNLSDIISLLDEIGVAGSPQGEDPRLRATVAAGTLYCLSSAEASRDAVEVPVREELDDSQDKQEGIRAGGVSAAFDGPGGQPGYSGRLSDIVTLLDRPTSLNEVPRAYGLEHADGVRPREQLYMWGLAV